MREKLRIIANAITDNPNLPYRGEVWGYVLAIIATSGTLNEQPSAIAAAPVAFASGSGEFLLNTRQFTLGTGGSSGFSNAGAGGSDGVAPDVATFEGSEATQTGFHALDPVDLFNLMVIPRDEAVNDINMRTLWGRSATYCKSRRAFLVIDSPNVWTNSTSGLPDVVQDSSMVTDLRGALGSAKDHAAVFADRPVTPLEVHDLPAVAAPSRMPDDPGEPPQDGSADAQMPPPRARQPAADPIRQERVEPTHQDVERATAASRAPGRLEEPIENVPARPRQARPAPRRESVQAPVVHLDAAPSERLFAEPPRPVRAERSPEMAARPAPARAAAQPPNAGPAADRFMRAAPLTAAPRRIAPLPRKPDQAPSIRIGSIRVDVHGPETASEPQAPPALPASQAFPRPPAMRRFYLRAS